ncbi:decaprenyl-phosphate phosphoribosyltransferase [Undibacterium flavidum]|uniref:Decaprenyl-phosphate phosphoribosyltransferase n=1 Tax=Undibacterium flavidum TaxID=2762297 RepID=A0ABR6Y9A7_9BURK|nr:decaprenyl-phosphate phosphoribosyltransferase [Undibacterium flavidum]MBC3873152.1 decaprenyl-phosphate phosphoribosyltransferase [Undibacterium flavidum]
MQINKLHFFVKLLRPKQWVKNIFVFAPLLFTGSFLNWTANRNVLITFLLFCVASSAAYIVNDIKDQVVDRLHPEKSQTRPIAAGFISSNEALIFLAILYLILLSGWLFSSSVMLVIFSYLLLNIAYSYYLKHQPVIDIFTIGIGFVLRVFSGAVALSVQMSGWMFITSLCLAIYLASIKRKKELEQNIAKDSGRQVLRSYSISLVNRYAEMSATGALVFYGMFVMSSKPRLLLTIPFVLFGIFRYWFVIEDSTIGEAPTEVVLSDVPLIITICVWILICMWALWPS